MKCKIKSATGDQKINYFIEINTIEDILALCKKYESSVIVDESAEDDVGAMILIYDGYIE